MAPSQENDRDRHHPRARRATACSRGMPMRGGSLQGCSDDFCRGNCHCWVAARLRLGVQGVRRTSGRSSTIAEGLDEIAVFGRGRPERHALRGVRLVPLSVVRDGAFVHVAIGSIVDTPTIRPTEHIFVGSKAPWFEITTTCRIRRILRWPSPARGWMQVCA